jgi:hypothetical protein
LLFSLFLNGFDKKGGLGAGLEWGIGTKDEIAFKLVALGGRNFFARFFWAFPPEFSIYKLDAFGGIAEANGGEF